MTKMSWIPKLWVMVLGILVLDLGLAGAGGSDPYGNQYEDPNKKILKSGLLGAATGAISAEASGGKAGTGALVGAGTNVIGGALLDTLTAPSPQPQQAYYAPAPAPTGYAQPAPQPQQQVYYQEPPRQQVYYAPPPQPAYEDPNKKILKSGLLGAGTGAIAASASGGKAGTGALVGAGTNIIGGALLDTLTAPSPQPQQAYYAPAPQPYYPQQQYQSAPAPTQQKKIIRKYDAEGNVVSEEEVYQ